MAECFACIAGEEIYRLWQAAVLTGDRIGPAQTPFGASGEIFRVENGPHPFYVLARSRPGLQRVAPRNINARANLYALKDLGARAVLGWGPAAAITHSITIGDLVIVSDLIDMTFLRDRTFFETSPLGYLREFPVFCEALGDLCGQVLRDVGLLYHPTGIAAAREGPRLETPAEVRMLAALGAQIVTFTLVPEVFLAKELQLCYAGLCRIINYAETGSRHRPFDTNGLFDGMASFAGGPQDRLERIASLFDRVLRGLADAVGEAQPRCQCARTMADHVEKYNLDEDWRTWFS